MIGAILFVLGFICGICWAINEEFRRGYDERKKELEVR